MGELFVLIRWSMALRPILEAKSELLIVELFQGFGVGKYPLVFDVFVSSVDF
jgi:hypothetical protein